MPISIVGGSYIIIPIWNLESLVFFLLHCLINVSCLQNSHFFSGPWKLRHIEGMRHSSWGVSFPVKSIPMALFLWTCLDLTSCLSGERQAGCHWPNCVGSFWFLLPLSVWIAQPGSPHFCAGQWVYRVSSKQLGSTKSSWCKTEPMSPVAGEF